VHRTFRDAATEYLARLTETIVEGQKGFADLPNKRRNVVQYLIPFFDKHRIDKVSTFLVQHYTKDRLAAGAKLASVNRELSTLSHLFTQAVEWKWIKDDSRPAIRKDQEPGKKIAILLPEHAEALFHGAVADQDPQTWLFVAIGLSTAMRHGEILRIKWADIELNGRRINVERAKAGQRIQPITESLADALRKEYQQRTNQIWLFPATRANTKTPYRRDMDRQFQRAVIRAGLDPSKVTPHIMRHTGITRLVKAGIDLPTIQRISGHKTLKALMRYVHLDDDHIDRSIAAIDTAFLGSFTPELHTPSKQAAESDAKVVAISSAKPRR